MQRERKNSRVPALRVVTALTMAFGVLSGCTKSAHQFRLRPTDQAALSGADFPSEKQVDRTVDKPVETTVDMPVDTTVDTVVETVPAVDILWVIDNSGSMKNSQKKLQDGLENFARTYFKVGSDIQIGVITTDAYAANEAWAKYLATDIPGTKETTKQHYPNLGPRMAMLKSTDLLKTKGADLSELIKKFTAKVHVGISGLPDERGLDSIREFLLDNESNEAVKQKLFRKGSRRVVIVMSDEDDSSIDHSNFGPEPRELLTRGHYYVGKDEKVAKATLPSQFTIDCKPTVVDSVTFAPTSVCAREELLESVASFKTEYEAFFHKLDGTAADAATNFAFMAIVAKDAATITTLRIPADKNDVEVSHTRGDRYIELVKEIGGLSLAMDIGAESYDAILTEIGKVVQTTVQTVVHSTVPTVVLSTVPTVVHDTVPTTTFTPTTAYRLERAPAPGELFVVTLIRASGASAILTSNQYSVSGNTLTLTDANLISSLLSGDQIRVRYQPATVLPAN